MKSYKWNFHTTMLINPELWLRGSSPTPGAELVESNNYKYNLNNKSNE
jgi:hypothetical protein